MASIFKLNRFRRILPAIIKNQARCISYAYPDWKPGPYPKTKEEREAAAKKYGMLPEEYEPYPDDGSGFGDYPKLPLKAYDEMDQNLPWNINTYLEVRNYGEPIRMDALLYMMDKYCSDIKTAHPLWYIIYKLFGVFLGTMVFILFFPWNMYLPAAPKQLPHRGQTHYTFETVD